MARPVDQSIQKAAQPLTMLAGDLEQDESCQAPVILSIKRPEPSLPPVGRMVLAACLGVVLLGLCALVIPQVMRAQVQFAPSEAPLELPVVVAPPAMPERRIELRETWPLKRRVHRDSDELRRQLLVVPDVEYRELPAATRQLMAAPPRSRDIYIYWPDRAGLPVRLGRDSELRRPAARERAQQARLVHACLAEARTANGIDVPGLRDGLAGKIETGGVGVLNELLAHEDKAVRLVLVDVLRDVPGRAAAGYLAQRALFDISEDVRSAAVEALALRPRQEYRELLLEGFRYPWPPVADHAAEALIALDDTRALPRLVELLGKPGPGLPWLRGDDQTLVTLELVRVNHLGNCLLCHAESARPDDKLRSAVPLSARPLPTAFDVATERDWKFVRADVTYVHQDFTVMQPVEHHGPWPPYQRYDYVVRTRPVAGAELQRLNEHFAPGGDFEQRQAVLFALRELSRRDVGERVRAWRELLDLD